MQMLIGVVYSVLSCDQARELLMADDSHEHHNIPDNSIIVEFVVSKGKLPRLEQTQLMRQSGWNGSGDVQVSSHKHGNDTHYTYLFLPGADAIAKKFAAKVKSKGVSIQSSQYRGGKERPYVI
jgi:hypothetical protein